MSEPRFKFDIADEDLAFIKGLSLEYGFDVNVKAGEPYILHNSSDHVISIINHEDRWGYENLYAVNVAVNSGYDGVYADSEDEAIYLFADYCAEMIADPDNPNLTKRRYPGLIQTWRDIVDEVGEEAFENYSGHYDGAWGNEGWYFTEHGHPATAKQVPDRKMPPIPAGLFPYVETFPLDEVLDYTHPDRTVRDHLLNEAYWHFRIQISEEYGDQDWHGRLEDLVDESHRGEGMLDLVPVISLALNPEQAIVVYIVPRNGAVPRT